MFAASSILFYYCWLLSVRMNNYIRILYVKSRYVVVKLTQWYVSFAHRSQKPSSPIKAKSPRKSCRDVEASPIVAPESVSSDVHCPVRLPSVSCSVSTSYEQRPGITEPTTSSLSSSLPTATVHSSASLFHSSATVHGILPYPSYPSNNSHPLMQMPDRNAMADQALFTRHPAMCSTSAPSSSRGLWHVYCMLLTSWETEVCMQLNHVVILQIVCKSYIDYQYIVEFCVSCAH